MEPPTPQPKLKVQEFLEKNTLPDLQKKHGVYFRFSTKNPKKFTLNYDQIEAREGDRLAEECRGLVLELIDENVPGPTRVLAYPFNRFYNDGQKAASNIDWDTATVFEKLDGTLCIVYWDETLNEFCVATRNVPDADLPYENVTNKTFRQLFDQAAVDTYLKQYPNDTDPQRFYKMWIDPNQTYMFELTTPENQVVVKHTDYKIWLLGIRNNQTFKEENIWKLTKHFDICPSFKLNKGDITQFVNTRDPSKYEGVVVCDKNFRRIKIKNPEYAWLNKLRDRIIKSPRGLLEAFLQEKMDDIEPTLTEEMRRSLDRLKMGFSLLEQSIDRVQQSYAGPIDNRKEYASHINQINPTYMSPLMFIYSKKGSFKDWINSNQNENGTFPNGFLDTLLEAIENLLNSPEKEKGIVQTNN